LAFIPFTASLKCFAAFALLHCLRGAKLTYLLNAEIRR